ncbi:MAG: restriction endonuclease subunit S [Rhodocyclaceae bacterium]|nr:restriction endonuclease subunit S [Rhodocyclaceae bacterium]
MAGEWPVVTLQDVCETITDGAHLSPKDCDGGLPMDSVKDMARWGIDVKSSRTISHEDFDDLVRNGCQPQIGDVLIAKDGATCLDTVCEFTQPDKIVLLSSVAILRPSKRLHSGYLRYYLDCADTRAMLKAGYVSGSAIPRVVLKDFRRAPIPLPPLAEQKAIAAVLGALDDKIELNRRMNATLEAMARALFQSWFVDFDPVRAKLDGRKPTGLGDATATLFPATFQDSPLGHIPEGWGTGSILRQADLLSGGTPKTDVPAYWNGDVPWASAKDVSQCGEAFLVSTERTITQRGVEESSTKIIPEFATVVVARGATTGRLTMFGHSMAMNQTCYGLRSKVGAPFALYCNARYFIERLVQGGHGSIFDTITTSTFEATNVLLAQKEVLVAFDEQVTPLFQQVHANLHQSRTLATLRNALLPKLLSGELSVSQCEPAPL